VVTVVSGALLVYDADNDLEHPFPHIEGLQYWLDDHEAEHEGHTPLQVELGSALLTKQAEDWLREHGVGARCLIFRQEPDDLVVTVSALRHLGRVPRFGGGLLPDPPAHGRGLALPILGDSDCVVGLHGGLGPSSDAPRDSYVDLTGLGSQ